jgi:hypothetical protein
VAYERLGGYDNLKKAHEFYSLAAKKGNKSFYREALTRVVEKLRRLEKSERP